jgi:pilus assembly protein CpaE
VDVGFLRTILLQHSSGIQVLLAPPTNDDERSPDPESFDHVLQIAQEMFDYIVIDVGPLYDSYASVALQHADQLLLVITPETTALQRALLFLDAARQHGFPLERVRLVINRANARGGIAYEEIEGRLMMQDPFLIPDDISLITYSVNEGVPFMISHPKSAAAAAVVDMARKLTGHNGQGVAIPINGKPWQRLSQRLKGLLLIG